ncbi:lamin tail domain-containing protein [Flammeovirgaceae bacterium SG7u.111]|nr:lamin tail domain-containing protein [Flammeovirgaceae bacterium SG7u.132]WPO36081.1 lamin tail domain-containing protein [Flammeovirgaceae bacterium SG7u.111]
MKKTTHALAYLCLLLTCFVPLANGQTSELFFSEYIEGSNVNKALEIYNGTGAPVDLSTYTIEMYFNGNTSPSTTIPLSGTLATEDVFVVADDGADAAILAVTDLTSNASFFNGDDAIVLKNGSTIIDVIGQVGTDPGSEWGSGDISTQNNTIRRTSSSCQGDIVSTDAFDPSVEWEGFPQNTFDGLGSHTTTCASGGVSVKINEIRVDQPSSDDDEYFELAGAANTSLDELTYLVIGDGPGGSGTIENVTSLAGQSIDSSGYFVAAEATFGALGTADFTTDLNFENSDNVTHLLVKGFTGTNGDDLDTDDDGVLDTTPWESIIDEVALVETVGSGEMVYSSTTVGPDGTFVPSHVYLSEGVWKIGGFDLIDGTDTPGAENFKEIVLPPSVAENIIINEIDADTEGTDAEEFIELYDGGVGNTALDGLVIVLFNGSDDASYSAIDLDGQTTDANGYFVIGSASVPNVDMVAFTTNGLQNGADAVALYEGDATDFPNDTPITTDNLFDAIVYDTNDGDDAALLVLLNANEPQVNEGENGNNASESLQRIANGTGGARNTSTYVAMLPTPGSKNSAPIALLINEFLADPAGDLTGDANGDGTRDSSQDEFVELYNSTSSSLNISGWTVSDGVSVRHIFPANTIVPSEGTIVIFGGGTPTGTFEGSLVQTASSGSLGLNNGGDVIVVKNGSETIDSLSYDSEGGDNQSVTRSPDITGEFIKHSTVDTKLFSPGTLIDGTKFPGNSEVVEPPVGDLITIAEAKALPVGSNVIIQGVLTASDQFGGPAYIQDTTGGIAIFDATVHGDGVYKIGDELKVAGSRTEFNGLQQLGSISSVELIQSDVVIAPVDITVSQLASYEGKLVRIPSATFPQAGMLLFGNNNFTISDASGEGVMRLDNDVSDLVGKLLPASCDVIGIVGTYNGTPQLLPRLGSDLPCATSSNPGDGGSSETTLDIVTWNIEWFGSTGNGPSPESTQKENAKAVILALDADLYAFQEIADENLLQTLADELPDYELVINLANVSYPPNVTGNSQKLAFLYKTSVITPISSKGLLTSIHPYYNGGDGSVLTNAGYPDPDASRFYASGRLPFLLEAEVSLNGTTENICFVNLHARANSSNGPQERYDMRKFDVTVLKDSLDAYYGDKNVVVLGDYNDDVDETVADVSTTVTTYEAFINDPTNYNTKTISLSNRGFRSYVSYENMIDHIMLTNELFDNYIDSSETVHYEFFDSNYENSTSDHFPVSLSLNIGSIDEVVVEDLNLTSVCSDDPSSERKWKVTNPNDFEVEITWLIDTLFNGSFAAPAGMSYFSAPTIRDNRRNKAKISWYNEKREKKSIYALSEGEQCGADLSFYRGVNLGGGQMLTIDGNEFEPGWASNLILRGTSANLSWVSLADAPDDSDLNLLLDKVTYGNGAGVTMTNVPNGTYQVYLYLVEWQGDDKFFNISLNGNQVESNANLSSGTWGKMGPWSVNVTNGEIKVETSGAVVGIAGMEVWTGGSTPNPQSPAAPSNLALSNDGVELMIQWNDNASNETSFVLEAKAASAGSYSEIATLDTDVEMYKVAVPGEATSYRVKAVNASGASPYSNTATYSPTVSGDKQFYKAYNLGGSSLTIDGNEWQAGWSGELAKRGGNFNMNWLNFQDASSASHKAMLEKTLLLTSGGTGVDVLGIVPNGTYEVYLYVVEWEDKTKSYDVKLNGSTVESNVSLAESTWKKLGPWQVEVTNGEISVSTVGDAAALAGVEILSVTSGASSREALGGLITKEIQFSNELLVYPNPAINQFSIDIPATEIGKVSISLSDLTGRRIQLGNLELTKGINNFQVQLQELNVTNGMYLLQVEGGAQKYPVVKIMIGNK